MLSEIFKKPKPIIGTIQLLPLPGATDWNGRFEPVMSRAEQEATALASGGVDGIILENTYDTPHRLERIDTAAAIAMAMIARRVSKFTPLPLGISVLRNDPVSAFAVAMNVSASFIRVPVLAGSVITENGLTEGRVQELAEYKQRLKPLESPRIFADVSLNHLVPGRILSLISGPQRGGDKGFNPADFLISHLKQVATTVEQYDMAHALVLNGREVTPPILQALKASVSIPIFVEDPGPPDALAAYYEISDGILLSNSVKKPAIPGMDPRPSVDMLKVEEMVLTLRPQTHVQPSGSPN